MQTKKENAGLEGPRKENVPEGTLHKEGAPPVAFDILIIAV